MGRPMRQDPTTATKPLQLKCSQIITVVMLGMHELEGVLGGVVPAQGAISARTAVQRAP
jgi:hypothetical protein